MLELNLHKMDIIGLYDYVWAATLISFAFNVLIGAVPLIYTILWGKAKRFWIGWGLIGLTNAVLSILLFRWLA